MRVTYRLWPVVAFFPAVIGAGLLLSTDRTDVKRDRQRTDLAQVQELLSSNGLTAEYRLIPESIMTGFCWRAPGGAKEGLFKDVNSGMAHWREQVPLTPDHGGRGRAPDHPAALTADDRIGYAQLSTGLERLSFQTTGYSFAVQAAEITGVLTIGDYSRRVTLQIDLPKTVSPDREKDLIELTASTVINPADFGDTLKIDVRQPLGLCIAMQAAKQKMLPDPSSDGPLLLSHYY